MIQTRKINDLKDWKLWSKAIKQASPTVQLNTPLVYPVLVVWSIQPGILIDASVEGVYVDENLLTKNILDYATY